MTEQLFNNGWRFWITGDEFAMAWQVPARARPVELPHDAMLERPAHAGSPNGKNTGYRDGAVCHYARTISVPADWLDKTAILRFEGVYMNASVYVNGALAGACPYGYSTFHVDLGPHLRYGEENELRVTARNGAMPNSRWYSGGGIYRDVYLLLAEDLIYIPPDGVRVKTEAADQEVGVVEVTTELCSRMHYPEDIRLETVLLDAAGTVVASDQSPLRLYEREAGLISQRMAVAQPALWSAETPALYTCRSRLYRDDKLVDGAETIFGIRTLTLDARRGLRVNGRPVKLRGACIHHDAGLLGAAAYKDAQARQIRRLKQAGFNAVRMSHHPMAQPMLRACDELGMYVMDETFDMWTRSKNDYDYAMHFEEWWQRDVEAMVRQDYCHPCVVLYSLGNEIPEIGTDAGAAICHRLARRVRELDDTRYTLAAINGLFVAGDAMETIAAEITGAAGEPGADPFEAITNRHMDAFVIHGEVSKRLDKACAATDIAGYNYMTARYEPDGRRYPNRVIVGSETFPSEITRNWALVERHPHLIGDFTWTGWDYLGEVGGYGFPRQMSDCGDMDITGARKPASYYREMVFGLRQAPYLAVHIPGSAAKPPSSRWILTDGVAGWTWPGREGRPVTVEVFAPGDEVELLQNGRSLGRKPAGPEASFTARYEATYTPGELTAVAYRKGAELGRHTLKTAGETRRLALLPEAEPTEALVYLALEVRDAAGILATDDTGQLSITVEGDCALLGFGSGDPAPAHNFPDAATHAWGGRALAILKKGKPAGAARVAVESPQYGRAEATLRWSENQPAEVAAP